MSQSKRAMGADSDDGIEDRAYRLIELLKKTIDDFQLDWDIDDETMEQIIDLLPATMPRRHHD